MKLSKSLLLGSAAALVATAGAQAADLPYRKAAPVEYVRVCDWTGAGYFYIPGTDTCLKIGGFVRAEYEYNSVGKAFIASGTGLTGGLPNGQYLTGRNHDSTGFFVRGRLTTDARTQTAYGVLRTYIQAQFDRTSGAEFTNAGGSPAVPGGPQGSNSTAYIDKAFVQFAGITAGRVQSFYDFGADPYGFDGVATTDNSTQAFAYTATFGGGFSATVSVEDPNARRYGINNTLGTTGTPVNYSGDKIPDIVGVLRIDQAWGAAQLSGAYHQLATAANTAPGTSIFGRDGDGFGVHGAVQIKLPMLAAGDEFNLEGGYETGATAYVNSNTFSGDYGSPIVVGGLFRPSVDAIAIAAPGAPGAYTLAKARSYSVSGGFVHFLTPNFNNIVFGSYEHSGYGAAKNIAWYNGGVGDANQYRIADQVNWFPVKDLQIGVEFMYIKTTQKVPGTVGNPVAGSPVVALPAGIVKDPDSFEGRLRIERDF